MNKLLELREAFNELVESLRKKRDSMGSSNGVSLKGPVSVNQGDTVSWEISNFDIASSYQVASDLGTVSINEKIITFKHDIGKPVHTPFDLTVICNGAKRVVKVPIQEVGIMAPYLTSISAVFVNNKYSFTLTMSPYTVYPTGSSSHTSTDWEIASDPDFTTILWSSLNNTTNKTTVTTGGFDPSLTLYLRVRYRGTSYVPSRWYSSPIKTNNQLNTSYSTSFTTSYSAGSLKTTSHVTQWITEKNTMDYSIVERTTSIDTAYRDWNGNEWVDGKRITSWRTSHVTAILSDTTWNTGSTTSYETASGYQLSTSHVTSYDTLFQRTTSRDTYKSWTTTWSASRNTSGSVQTSGNTSWTTFDWGPWIEFTQGKDSLAYTNLNQYLWNWRNINYPGDEIVYLGKNASGDQLYFKRRHRTNIHSTNRTTSWNTSGTVSTVYSTSKITDGLKNTSWSTAVSQVTSHTTSYDTVYGFDTSIVTSWPTQHVTTSPTSWTTSNGTSHYTSYTTGGSRTTSITTSWTSTQSWMTNWTTSWNTIVYTKMFYPPGDPNGYFGTIGLTTLTSAVVSRTTSVSTPMSRTTSWTTSDAQTTGHTTSYTTSYSTGQDTSWTTTYDTSQTTTWITGIRLTSKVTSNSTSNLTDV